MEMDTTFVFGFVIGFIIGLAMGYLYNIMVGRE
jgi:hypothetical protein